MAKQANMSLNDVIGIAERIAARENVEEKDKADAFVSEEGASLSFSAGTYILRCRGVAVSCTAGPSTLLAKWIARARKMASV